MKSSPIINYQRTQWDGIGPSISSIRGLIEQISQAALIWNRSDNRIIIANQKFSSLVNCSPEDLFDRNIDELFAGSIIDELSPGVECATAVRVRKKESIPVLVNVSVLDSECHWWLLRFDDLANYEQFVKKNLEVVLKKLSYLSRLTDYPDVFSSIRAALKVARSLLGTDYICIYNVSGGEPDISKIATIEKTQVFPKIFPATDSICLTKPMTWNPGAPISSEIHKCANQANFSYVTSMPLGNEKAVIGLLVAGDIDNEMHKIKHSVLELIGSHVGNALQHFILVQTLRERVKEQEESISIHDTIFEGSKEGIVIISNELNVLEINPTAELMLGYSNNEIYNETVENILIGPQRLLPALEMATRGIATHDIGSVSLHRRNGQAFPAHIQILPVTAERLLRGIIILIDDVSENEQIRL
ncbi:MAG: PAS domain-containing protein, partial [Anaerolineaceae bacterium]|nr:PAS domain-containing protein [Anaerolineaceae bacterium]